MVHIVSTDIVVVETHNITIDIPSSIFRRWTRVGIFFVKYYVFRRLYLLQDLSSSIYIYNISLNIPSSFVAFWASLISIPGWYILSLGTICKLSHAKIIAQKHEMQNINYLVWNLKKISCIYAIIIALRGKKQP